MPLQVSQLTVTFVISALLTVDTTAPGPGYVGQPYHFQFKVSGGAAPYVFKIIGGQLPAGLTLSSDGLVSGTPTQLESQGVTISVTDSGT